MSYKYRILRKPFQQAPPSTFQREQVKKDLSGDTNGFIMLQTSMRYQGNTPLNKPDFTLQEEEKLINPCTCHSYLIDYYTSDYQNETVTYDLVITYETPSGPSEEIVKLRPDQTYRAVPVLLLTFYPYDITNPTDNSYYSYSFSTTNLQFVVQGHTYNGSFNTEEISPDANDGRWIVYTDSLNDTMNPSELCFNRYFIFKKHYSDYSFHIRTNIGADHASSDSDVYSNVIHLLPVYYDSAYGTPLPLFSMIRDQTLPPPYS